MATTRSSRRKTAPLDAAQAEVASELAAQSELKAGRAAPAKSARGKTAAKPAAAVAAQPPVDPVAAAPAKPVRARAGKVTDKLADDTAESPTDKAASKSSAKASASEESKAKTKVEAQTEAKAEAKPNLKAVAKASAKSKTATKASTKSLPEVLAEPLSDEGAAPKAAAKAVVKAAAKPARKTRTKASEAAAPQAEPVAQADPVAKPPARKRRSAAAPADLAVDADTASPPAQEVSAPAAADTVTPQAKPKRGKRRGAPAPEAELASTLTDEPAGDVQPATDEAPDREALESQTLPMAADIEAQAEPTDAAQERPAPAPARAPRPYSEISLLEGSERLLCWQAADDVPEALLAQAEAVFGAVHQLSAEQAAHALPDLLNLAASLGHELRVDEAVWAQLAHGADTLARMQRLEALYPQGPQSPALLALLGQPLAPYQWEGAFFAVCAGRALLADDLGQSQRKPALAAWAIWQAALGLRRAVLLAPLSRHALWRQQAEQLLGAWPEGLHLLDPEALTEQLASDTELLIVDAVQSLQPEQLARWRELPVNHLLLLADRELLGDPLLPSLVAWLDAARRGPLARLQALGDVANKRLQREALQTVMLSRRKRDLADQLPLSQEHELWLPPLSEPDGLDAQALAQCRQALDRWQRLGYLSAAEQMPLWRALSSLRQAALGDPACAAKAEVLPGLMSDLLAQGARRVVVFAQQDQTLRQLYQGLVDSGWAAANIRRHQSAEVRQLELQAWAAPDEEGGCAVLLATDSACQGLDLRQDGVAVVHADLPWNPALLAARVQRVAGAQRAVPSWRLLMPGSFDAAQLAAHQGVDALPSACLDHELASVAIVSGEQLQVLMAALARAMAA